MSMCLAIKENQKMKLKKKKTSKKIIWQKDGMMSSELNLQPIIYYQNLTKNIHLPKIKSTIILHSVWKKKFDDIILFIDRFLL